MKKVEWGMLLSIAFLWSMSFIFMRIAVPEFGVYPFIGLRVGIAGLIMTFLMLVTSAKSLLQIRKYYKVIILAGLMNFAIPFAFFSYAANHLTAGISSVLNTFAPLLTVCLSHLFFNDKISLRQFFGVITSIIGVIIISIPKMHGGFGELLPILAALMACLFYAISTNFTKKMAVGLDSMTLTTGSLIIATIATFPLVIIYFPSHSISLHAWLAVIGIAIFSTCLAFILFYNLLQRVGTAKTISSVLLVPLFGTLLGMILLGEKLSIYNAVGSIVVLIGAMLVIIRR